MYTSLSFQPPPAANSSAGDYDVIVFVDGSSRLEIPMYHYATRVPAYARTIHIISSCPRQHHCDVEYIGNLTSYLRTVFPQSSCTTERVSSEWSIVSAILSAPSVVCNDASICVLRSLQGKPALIADSKSRFPWLSDLLNVPLPSVAFQVPGNVSLFSSTQLSCAPGQSWYMGSRLGLCKNCAIHSTIDEMVPIFEPHELFSYSHNLPMGGQGLPPSTNSEPSRFLRRHEDVGFAVRIVCRRFSQWTHGHVPLEALGSRR